MEKVIGQITDVFIHIARDILVYLLSGILVIGNVFLIDSCIFESKLFNYFSKIGYLPILIIIISYGLSQIIMAIMLILERIIEPILMKIGWVRNPNFRKEVNAFQKDRIVYDYFIERYNQLYYMRWTLAGACLMCTFLNLIFCSWDKCADDVLLKLGVVSFILFILLLILHYRTGNDLSNKIDAIDEILNKRPL